MIKNEANGYDDDSRDFVTCFTFMLLYMADSIQNHKFKKC